MVTFTWEHEGEEKRFTLFIEALDCLIKAGKGQVKWNDAPIACFLTHKLMLRLPATKRLVEEELKQLVVGAILGNVEYLKLCLKGLVQISFLMTPNSETMHYHLIATWPGCIPELNEVYTTERGALEAFELYLQDFDDEDFDYRDRCTAILKNNLQVYIEKCEGCLLWKEMKDEIQ